METGLDNSIAKAVRVLNALRALDDGGSARGLAQTTGVPRSTVQRILTTLEATGMVLQNRLTQRYYIGPQALLIGLGHNGAASLLNEARPHMVALRNETGETVGLSIAAGEARVFIDEVQSTQGLRFASELGRMYPLWSGANGRVLLSAMSDEEIESVLATHAHDQAVHQPLSTEQTRIRIEQIRRAGYAEASDEAIQGINSLAVPIHDGSGRVVAALSVSGPAERLTRERMDETLGPLRDVASAITARVGGPSDRG